MDKHREIDIEATVNRVSIGRFQVITLCVLALTVIVDGFDAQAIGFVAPAIVDDWHIDKSRLGLIFVAGTFGMLLGSLIFSVLADKFGRRPILIVSTVLFGASMMITGLVRSVPELELLRFFTGLGLGAIMPNAMALASEISPRGQRVTLMMLVSCGFTLGAVLGGFLCGALIPLLGWRPIFFLGGLAPLAIAGLLYFYVAESMQFLAAKGRDPAQIGKTLSRIDPSHIWSSATRYLSGGNAGAKPIRELFQQGRAPITLALWVINIMNLFALAFLASWLPTIARGMGLTLPTAVAVGTALQIGGVVGTLAMGPLIDRWGFFKVLLIVFVAGLVAVSAIGVHEISLVFLFAAVVIAGVSVVGGQPAVNALAAHFYPTALRSTGVGWSLGIGRIGSISGPLLGGEMIKAGLDIQRILFYVGCSSLISALTIVAIYKYRGGAHPAEQMGSLRRVG